MNQLAKQIPKLALILALVASLGLGQAQKPTNPPSESTQGGPGGQGERTFGTITSVGVDRVEIKRLDGSTQTVMVDEKTRYQQGQQEIQLEDLKPGDRVFVRGQTNANKEYVALMVRRVTMEEMQRFQTPGDRAGGQIVSIDKNQIVVRNNRQGEKTIVVNDQTQFMKEGQPITLKDLKVGDRIFALGKESDGQFVASRVSTGQFRGQGQYRREREQ